MFICLLCRGRYLELATRGSVLDSPRTRVGWRSDVAVLWVQGRGKRGEASGERTGPRVRYSLGNLLRLVPLHAYHGVLFGSRAGHSVCPAVLFPMTMTYAGTLRPGTRGNSRQVILFRAHRKRLRIRVATCFLTPPRKRPGPSCLAGFSLELWLGLPCQ